MLDLTGTYTLRAQATGLTDAISASFDVTTGLSRQTVFITQPSNVTAGSAIAPAVVVEVQDLQDNVDASFNGLVDDRHPHQRGRRHALGHRTRTPSPGSPRSRT